MKILIISSGFYPVTNQMGGAIENLIETYLIANETRYKNDITLYSAKTKSDKKEEKNNFRFTDIRIIDKTNLIFRIKRMFYGLKEKIFRKYSGNAYLREVIKDLKCRNEFEKYDYIIVENIGKFIPILRKYTDSKIILHLHNDYLNRDTEDAKKIEESTTYIWCVSEFIANRVREISSNDEKIKVIYNAINLNVFQKSKGKNYDLKNKLKIKNDDKVFLYVGRLMEEKGVAELLYAFKKIEERYENIKLLIIGGPKEINQVKNRYVKKLYEIADNSENIIFTGKVEYSELHSYYSIADIQIIPSLGNEAFGLIVLEGMSANLPMIVSNVGGIPEVAGKSVIYVERENIIDDLEKQIEKFIKDEIDINEVTKEYKYILSKFSEETYCNRFNSLLE